MAEALLGPRTYRKGTRFPVNDSPRAERKVFELPAESQVRVTPSGIREGVSRGSGRRPSLESSFTQERSLLNNGACPCGVSSAMTSETSRGLLVGVGAWSACSRHNRVSRSIWKMKAGRAAIEEVTDKSMLSL